MAEAKHLELLQVNIQRLAGNSFVIKGWAVTLLTAILGATLKEGRAVYALYGLTPILLFWVLDGYFLALERGFRAKYVTAAERVRAGSEPTFDMTPPTLNVGEMMRGMGSPAAIFVYGAALGVLVFAAVKV